MAETILLALAVAYIVALPVLSFKMPAAAIWLGIAGVTFCFFAAIFCVIWNAAIDRMAGVIGLRPDLHPFAIGYSIKVHGIYFFSFFGLIAYTVVSIVVTSNIAERITRRD